MYVFIALQMDPCLHVLYYIIYFISYHRQSLMRAFQWQSKLTHWSNVIFEHYARSPHDSQCAYVVLFYVMLIKAVVVFQCTRVRVSSPQTQTKTSNFE